MSLLGVVVLENFSSDFVAKSGTVLGNHEGLCHNNGFRANQYIFKNCEHVSVLRRGKSRSTATRTGQYRLLRSMNTEGRNSARKVHNSLSLSTAPNLLVFFVFVKLP